MITIKKLKTPILKSNLSTTKSLRIGFQKFDKILVRFQIQVYGLTVTTKVLFTMDFRYEVERSLLCFL